MIQNLNKEESVSVHWSLSSFIVFSIKSLCYCFNVFSFVWTPRVANFLAHEVCKWAARSNFAGFAAPDVLVSIVSGSTLGYCRQQKKFRFRPGRLEYSNFGYVGQKLKFLPTHLKFLNIKEKAQSLLMGKTCIIHGEYLIVDYR